MGGQSILNVVAAAAYHVVWGDGDMGILVPCAVIGVLAWFCKRKYCMLPLGWLITIDLQQATAAVSATSELASCSMSVYATT